VARFVSQSVSQLWQSARLGLNGDRPQAWGHRSNVRGGRWPVVALFDARDVASRPVTDLLSLVCT
jgi:hypothetical protein